jgi:pimeloyl-ACP methyl ester carboxylesterase
MSEVNITGSITAAINDPEFSREIRYLDGAVKIGVGAEETVAQFEGGRLVNVAVREVPDADCKIIIRGTEEHWENLLAPYPVPFYQCLQTANIKHGLELSTTNETFAYLPALNRLVQFMRTNAASAPQTADARVPTTRPGRGNVRREPITGGYIYLTVEDVEYRLYYEEAGQGVPLLLGHTAGSDGRQYRHLLCDEEVTRNFRCIAFDLPYHGKSLPPYGHKWWAQEYNMTRSRMLAFPNALADALELNRPVYMGSSMGGHLAIDLAHDFPERYRATIAVEGALRSATEYVEVGMQGIRREFDNPNVSRNSIGAAMLLNMSPYSPEPAVREVQWEYMCGGPGIFAGDLYYYYYDHNMSPEEAAEIDTSRCMLYLLTGEYDPNTSPAETKVIADLVKGCRFIPMDKLGHFPATENYAEFRKYILPVLNEIAATADNQ